MGCHACPLHYRVLEALDAVGSTNTAALVEKILLSLPMDKDRGLLYEPDAYETVSARVVRRSGRADAVIETCLSILGDAEAKPDEALRTAATASPHAEGHIRRHTPEARAAQVLSIVCAVAARSEPVRSALMRYRAMDASENRSWVCFFLTRTLGALRDPAAVDLLIDILRNDPTETALGLNPPPTHITLRAMRPYHRAAAAWALGEIGDTRAVPALLATVKDLDNAAAVREACAVALGRIGDGKCLPELKRIADGYPELATRTALLEACEIIRGPLFFP